MIPASPETQGHGTHSIAPLWEQYLEQLLEISER
jgi:hypothetical protein